MSAATPGPEPDRAAVRAGADRRTSPALRALRALRAQLALAESLCRADPPATPVTGGWPLAVVLAHAAQSIELSMQGYPQPRSALFRHSVGPLALAWFRRRGHMRHDLAAPIPGAPALDPAIGLDAAWQRLARAVEAFEVWSGPFAPHFAYGALDHAAYAEAHALHLADHLQAFARPGP